MIDFKIEFNFRIGHYWILRSGADSNYNIRRHLILVHGKTELSGSSQSFTPAAISSEKNRRRDKASINCIIMDSRPWGDFGRKWYHAILKDPCSWL
jgi:hypothetical protein